MQTANLKASIELSDQEGGGEFELSACLYGPQNGPGSDWLFFCLPGGGNTGKLFDLGQADGISYSFADHITQHGHSVITMDTPGTAGNPLPPDASISDAKGNLQAIWPKLLSSSSSKQA